MLCEARGTLSGQTQREVWELRNGRAKDQVTWADEVPHVVPLVVAFTSLGEIF